MAIRKPTTVGSTERREIADKIFAGMRDGLSALKACKAVGLPQSTLNCWLNDDPELAADYARARDDLMDLIADQIIDISDQGVELTSDGRRDWAEIQKHKLQVDTRRWLLSKLAPKKYGDKIELSGDPERPIGISKIERVVVDK